jgi:hypothetical protein
LTNSTNGQKNKPWLNTKNTITIMVHIAIDDKGETESEAVPGKS